MFNKAIGLRFVMAMGLGVAMASAMHGQDFKKQVIYQIVTDRFFDGDTTNNDPAQSKGLYDATKTNWHAYWGGDFAGIQAKMPYLKGMGVTAIWISPVVDNENLNTAPAGQAFQAPYHGYAARDFMKVEEHFGDSSNGWKAFDSMIASAHASGIKVIIDWANNHSNDVSDGEDGALYDDGALIASAPTDPNGVFHHNPAIGDFNNRYQVQYFTLEGLTDLNQENATVDAYLKKAAMLFQTHGVDGFRLDALKHATWGWEYSFSNAVYSNQPSFLFGEWMGGPSDGLYHDASKFANKSGIAELDFGVYQAMRDVFGGTAHFSELDGTIATENSNFTWQNDQVTFFDSHDKPRLLTQLNDQNRLNEAMAFLLTCRGIPIILYGDEQSLHNDTKNSDTPPTPGGDPYNRVQMTSFSTTTTGYKLVNKLAGLRQNNDALAYGGWQQRWISNDVYVYERKFFNDVVVVAINKNDTASQPVNGLNTALPAGNYTDYLGGLLGGMSLSVSAGAAGNNPAAKLTLPAHSVSVWQVSSPAAAPEVGSVGPTVGQPGNTVTVAGDGFGSAKGSVMVNGAAAMVSAWTNTSATFTVPAVANGVGSVIVKNAAGTVSSAIQFTVLAAKLIPVTLTVNHAIATNPGDNIFVTGSSVELGNWGTTFDTAVGPMLAPNYPNWFLNVSLPAGQTVQFKFVKIAADGTVTYENGNNRSYTVPASGVGSFDADWQN